MYAVEGNVYKTFTGLKLSHFSLSIVFVIYATIERSHFFIMKSKISVSNILFVCAV